MDQTDSKPSDGEGRSVGVGGGQRDRGRAQRQESGCASPRMGQPGFGDAFNRVRFTSGKESFLFIISVPHPEDPGPGMN